MKRVCARHGCPVVFDAAEGSYCAECRRALDRERGSRQDRGYDAEHVAERRRWARQVATGRVRCRRCRGPIAPGSAWDLGHPDAECPAPRAPEHQSCNRSAAGRAGSALRGE